MEDVALSEVVRNWAIVVGGIAALGLAFWRGVALSRQSRASLEQAEIARRGHVTDLFAKSVEQLGSDRLEVRLGSIYTLQQISADYEEFYTPVLELLAAYVRQETAEQEHRHGDRDIREIGDFLRQAAMRGQDRAS